jgi:Flp pilus assembly protein TadG
MRVTWNRDRGFSGQALVEFALIIPIFIFLVMGIFDLGRAVYGFNTINNAARQAARHAIVDQTPAHVLTEATQSGVNLGTQPADVTIDYRSASTPTVAGSCASLAINCLATVKVQYSWQAATPVIGALLGTIVMTGESQFPIESVCVEPTQPSCPKGT